MAAFIIVGLLLSSIPSLLGANLTQESEQQLYLLVLLPYPNIDGNPSWSGGPNVIPAVRIAIDNVRTSGILHGFNLSLLESDCGCNYTNRARINFLENILYSDKQVVGLLGPGCSASAVAIAPLANQKNISLINIHGAGTPQLSERFRFNNSFGIFGSSKGIVATMIAVIENRGWSQIAVLYDSSRIFQSSTHDAFIEKISTANISVMSAAISDNFYHLDKIMEESIRIVLLLAGPEVARKVMCTAYSMNLTHPRVQWLIIERSLTEFNQSVHFVYRKRTHNCSKETMIDKVLNGSVLITYRLANINKNPLSKNGVLTYDDFLDKYNSEIEATNTGNHSNQTIQHSPWGSMFYDAVWAMTFALNESRHAGLDLHKYGKNNYRSETETSMLRQAMERTDFEGVSGRISFDVSTGFNSRSFDISLVNNSKVLYIAYFDSEIDILIEVDLLEENFPKKVHLTPEYIIIILTVISLLLFTMTIFFHILSCCYRNDYFVRAASFKLNQVAFFGCYFLLFASLFMIINEGVSNILDVYKIVFCHAVHFLCSIGFTLLFGAMCAKTWRLFRIFTSWKPGKFLSDCSLLFFVLLASTVDIFLNIIWIAFDPFVIKESRLDFDGTHETIKKQCYGDRYIVWYLVIYLYNFFIVFIALLLALCTKKIRISGFQTKTVLKIAYGVFLLMGFAISLQVVFRLDDGLDHIVIFIADYCSLHIAVALSLYYLFLPPVYPRIKSFLPPVHPRLKQFFKQKQNVCVKS